MTTAETVWVALGSNLPGPLGHPINSLCWAVEQLRQCAVPGQRFDCSSWYDSAAMGMDGNRFINGVVRFTTRLAPDTMLQHLLAWEEQAGRVRERASEPSLGLMPPAMLNRPLDLDLLLYGDQIIHTATLEVPHPRMTERAFVLLPMLEIDPALVLPGLGPALAFRDQIQSQDCQPKLR